MNTLLKTRKTLLTAVAVLGLALATPAVVRADDEALYHKTLKATGYIETPGVGGGTCWIVDRDQKLVITNWHVVETKTDVIVWFPMYREGKLVMAVTEYIKLPPIKGRVLHRDPVRDLALVQLESLPADAAALPLAEQSAAPGTKVLAVGNFDPNKELALRKFWRLRTGEVLAKAFRVVPFDNQRIQASVINASAVSDHGDSGGPVVNYQGELIAVTSYGNRIDSWAIDVTEVRTFLARAFPSPRRLPGTTEVTGSWTLITNQNGRPVYSSLTLRADGSFVIEGDGVTEGSYTYANGELRLTTASRRGQESLETLTVTWTGDNGFRLQGHDTDYVAERR
jgi:S1-C subfamily serine protease